MTSDAKVGLLLGLIFIFIIAFLINGLPNFRDSEDGNNLTRNMTVDEPGPIGIGSEQLDIINNRYEGPRITLSDNQTFDNYDQSRFEMTLPGISDAVDQVQQDNSDDAGTKVFGKGQAQNAGVLEVKQEQPRPKVYVVQKGDNLTKIAKKFYGPVVGSKKKTMDRLFEANRSRLKSPDKLKVGQKIVIPVQGLSDAGGIFDSDMFEKVVSMESGYSSGGGALRKFRLYKVKDGDSLWKIAVKELGGGVRYKDIIRLNREKLADEDTLKVGMRLRLPAK